MFSDDFVDAKVQGVLHLSEKPLHWEEIACRVYEAGMENRDVDLATIYSPHKRYRAGTRLYHPASGVSKWFTVREPLKTKSFTASFDDGEEMLLAQGDPEIGKYQWAPEVEEQTIFRRVLQNLQSRNDVISKDDVYISTKRFDGLVVDRLSNPSAVVQLEQLRVEAKMSDNTERLRELCKLYRLTRLYYLTPVANLPSVLDNGILAKNLAPKGHASFANEDIQSKRHIRRPNRRLSMTLHDFVPVFFAPKPPLLYLLRESQSEIACLLINPVVLLEPGMAFCNTNARSAREFFIDIEDLARLRWDILQSTYWGNDDEDVHRQNKLYRQAEAEIPLTIPVDCILEIGLCDDDALRRAKNEVLARKLPIKVFRDNGRLYC